MSVFVEPLDIGGNGPRVGIKDTIDVVGVRTRAGCRALESVAAARDAGPDDLLAADGYVFACPENLAAIAGLMKDFFDRSYYGVLDHINGRPYATVVCAGSDGSNAVRQIARIATGWRLREIAPPLIVCTHAQTTEAILAPKVVPQAELDKGTELGAAFAAGLAIGAF